MSKIALYRKYRPSKFSQIIDQKLIIQTLINSISSKRINHAYIFSGPKGSGKTSIAKIFAKSVNCLDLQFSDCCNKCENCLSIDKSIDFLELDAASNNGVDEIRKIIETVVYQPMKLKYKVYIIDEAHMLTTNAWNAFLKTLEEAPAHIIFIFATTEFNKIPGTIISRCQRYDFKKISNVSLIKHLKQIAIDENINIDNAAITTIVDIADGSARDAISILDQLSTLFEKIKLANVEEIYGLININNKINLLNLIFSHSYQDLIIAINEYDKKGIDFYILLNDLLEIILDKLIFIKTNNFILLKKLTSLNVDDIKTENIEKLIEVADIWNKELFKIKKCYKPRFNFEILALKASEIFNQKNKNIPMENKQINYESLSDKKFEIETKLNSEIKTSKKEETLLDEGIFKTKPLNKTKKLKKDEIYFDDSIFKITPLNISNLKNKEIKKESLIESLPFEQTLSEIKETESQQTSNSIPFDNTLKRKLNITFSLEEIFFRIANNLNNDKRKKFNEKLTDILKENNFPDELYLLQFAEKFLITSENGCVILFKNETSANNFNKIIQSELFNNWFEKMFGEVNIVIGVDRDLSKRYAIVLKQISNDIKLQKDLNIDIIKNSNSEENSTKLLLDILNN